MVDTGTFKAFNTYNKFSGWQPKLRGVYLELCHFQLIAGRH